MGAGGLNVGRAARSAGSILSLIEQMRERRREREHPEGGLIEALSRLEPMLGGREIENIPGLIESVAGRRGVERPEAVESVRGVFAGQRSAASQARFQDFQRNLANTLNTLEQTRGQNQLMLSVLREGNPETAAMFERQLQIQEQQLINATLQNLELGFGDISDMPEVQELLQRVRMQAVLGPGSQVQGGIP